MSRVYEYLKGKYIAVHCKTEEEAEEFLEMLKYDGIKWLDGNELTDYNNWIWHKEYTCYIINDNKRMLYGSCKYFRDYGKQVITFTELKKKIKEEEKMEFTKKNLKSEMVVELRNGSKRLIIECDEGLIYVEISNADFASQYNKYLTHSVHKHLDIQKVFDYPTISINYMIEKNKKPIWERKSPKEMTIKEIEKELGYPVKIVEK